MSSDLLKQKALALLKRDREYHALRQRHTRALGWLRAVDDLSRISGSRDLDELLDQWPVVMVRHLNIQCAFLFRMEVESSTLVLVNKAGTGSYNRERQVISPETLSYFRKEGAGIFNEPDQHSLQSELGLVRFFWSLTPLFEKELYLLVAGYDSEKFSFFPRLDDRDKAYFRMMLQNLESLSNNLSTIADLQRLNASLEEKEVRFRTLFEKIPTGIVVTGPNQTLIHANQSFRNYTGYTADELAGKSLEDLTHPDDCQETSALIDQVVSGVRDGFTMSNRYLRKDGSEFLSNGLVIPRLGPEGEAVELFAVIEDITERKATETKLAGLEHELRHSQKLEALGRLAGGVAHDFNNLLTAIIVNTHFVSDEMPAGDPRRDDLQEVLRAADSATELTGQLLSFSRRRVARTTVFEINDALARIHKMLRRTLREAIELVLLPTEESIFVRFSFSQFEQLILNLAVNAQHAMPDGGELTIEIIPERVELARHPGPSDYVRIAVIDTGCGMSADTIEKAFEPFFSTKGEDGTGLGLSTCYGIVTQAGGTIKLDSEMGSGTTVTIHLPRVPRPVDRPISKNPVRYVATHRGTILVVEDQPAILKLIVRTLKDAGYEVLQARTAEQACAMVERDKPDLQTLVTDVVLPGFSGVELRRLLRAQYPNLRVLLVSGYSGDQCESIEEEDNMTSFLPKPFSADQLVGAVGFLGAMQPEQSL